jgi:hypothetical protein
MGAVKLNPDFICKEIDGEMVMMNAKTGDYFGLNEVGTDLFRLIDGQRDVKDIILELLKLYDVAEAVLEQDV